MTTTLEWSNGMLPRGRSPWLLLVKGGKLQQFKGQSIPGLVAVTGDRYKRNGKWSATTYQLALAKDVRALSGANGWETGSFLEGLSACVRKQLNTWADVAEALGVSREEAEKFVRGYAEGTAATLDKRQADLAALEGE